VTVELAGFQPMDVAEAALAVEPAVGSATAGLRVGATVAAGDAKLDLLLTLIDTRTEGWRPTVVAGAMPDGRGGGPGGILLSEEAARDLRIGVGDEVVVRHPRRTEQTTVASVETRMPVVGLQPNPIRSIAYLDLADADLLGLEGVVNVIDIVPASGATQDDVVRALFGRPGVVSVQPVEIVTRVYRDLVEEFIGVLVLLEAMALLLALLVAFNSASIATDERAREHATMLAFGVPVGRVLGIEVAESVLLGLAGTVVGLLVGVAVIAWFVGVKVPEMMPELGITIEVTPGTVGVVLLVGVLVVGLAPLLMTRRLRRMNLPGTLRLVE
jgi:putative ABC transport system permease protein